MTFYSLDAELKIPHSGIWVTRGKSTEHHCTRLTFWYFPGTHNYIWHWQPETTAVLTLEAVDAGTAIHHRGLTDLHHLSKMKQLSFHSSERGLHSFSPMLLSQLRNRLHYLLRYLTLKQH